MVCCVLLVDCCGCRLLFGVCCLWFVAFPLLSVVRRWLFRCLLFVDGCLVFVSEVVGRCLFVACRSLLVVCCLLRGVCFAVFVVS